MLRANGAGWRRVGLSGVPVGDRAVSPSDARPRSCFVGVPAARLAQVGDGEGDTMTRHRYRPDRRRRRCLQTDAPAPPAITEAEAMRELLAHIRDGRFERWLVDGIKGYRDACQQVADECREMLSRLSPHPS
jgi:hypothetical protein